jgi:DNA-binding SARP family transcriptional activator
LQLKVLGPIELATEGTSVPIGSPLQRMLLAMLVADVNRVVGIDRIVDALWDHTGWDAGHQRLWFHVSKLRGRLADGPATIERSGPGYRLRVDELRIDARRFELLGTRARDALDVDGARAAQLATDALDLWRGDPYEDVSEDVVGRAERTRLAELRLGTVELWVEAELRTGRVAAVIPELDKLIVDHPYRERLRAQLMRALWMQQRQSEALAVFADTRTLLDEELGVAPSPALRDLAGRIAAGTTPSPRPAGPRTRKRSTGYGADVFVGRERELSQLLDATAHASGGRPSARFVRGQAGSGKTSLLRTLVAGAESSDDGLVGLYVTCQPGTGPVDPFGPFRDIARRLDGDGSAAPAQMTTAAGAVRLVAAGPLPPVATGVLDAMDGQRDRPAAAVADLIRQMIGIVVGRAPLLLVIDDLHWADDASIDMLRRLTTQIDGGLTIVAAYRRHELVGQQVPGLERDVQARTGAPVVIDLDDISSARRRAFVDALLDREPNAFDEAFRRSIAERSEGLALFAVELIDELRRRGAIRREGARWVHTGSQADDAWPARVHAVLDARFARVDDAVMAALRAASVEGETFTSSVVAEVIDRAEHEVIDGLSTDAATVHQVVTAIGPHRLGGRTTYRYLFRHNLFQRFVYDSLDPVERALLHGRVAAVLATLTDGHGHDEWAVTLARHHEAAGDVERAVRQLGRAAQRAVRLSANDQAVAHVEHALTLLATLPPGPGRDELEADLYTQLGVARSIIAGFSDREVERIFERSAALLSRSAPERRFPVLFGLFVAAVSRADVERSAALAADVTDAAERADDDGLRVMALHAQWTDRMFYGDLAGCLTAVEVSRDLYRHELHHPLCYRYGNHDAAVCGRGLGAVTAALMGDTTRAGRLLTDARELAEVLDHHPSRVQALAFVCWVRQLAGEIDGTVEAADRVLALEAGGAVPLWFGLARFMRGWALAVHGGDGGALAMLEAELATQQAMRTMSWMPMYAALLADAYNAAGRPDDALRTAAAGDDPQRPFYACELMRVRADARALRGDTVGATEELVGAVRQAHGWDATALALRSSVRLAQLAPEVGHDVLTTVVAGLPAGHSSPLRTSALTLLAD